MTGMRKLAVRLQVGLYRVLRGQRGAQTLEWLALALLILAILGTAAGLSDGEFARALKEKFVSMVGKIDSK